MKRSAVDALEDFRQEGLPDDGLNGFRGRFQVEWPFQVYWQSLAMKQIIARKNKLKGLCRK